MHVLVVQIVYEKREQFGLLLRQVFDQWYEAAETLLFEAALIAKHSF